MSVKHISIKNFWLFLKDLFHFRSLILELSIKDFKTRFLGSYLGIFWAFIQPFFNIIIMWSVFEFAFRSKPIMNVPFILWLMCALIPWFFFSDALNSATNSILENSFMVKKIVFRVSVLPIVKIISSLFVHLFFILVLFLMFLVYGFKPDLYCLQIIYYIFASIALVLGIAWTTASLVVFIKDIGQIVGLVLQFGFWLTPIFWDYQSMTAHHKTIAFFVQLNPLFYIVEGFRNLFIHKIWFWQRPLLTLYFWIFVLLAWILGTLIFKKLRPHFADVL
ncbi:MAG: ABC transporter permease [Patescibacteria group bacterium]|nr:ABC transporter permease [Patescibacteria group bacterium]